MNVTYKTVLILAAALGIVASPVHAAQESQPNPQVWERFYGGYDFTAKQWNDVPGVQYFSLQNGTPYFDMQPELDTFGHQGTLGFEVGDVLSLFGSERGRIEVGGASEEGAYKRQLDIPIVGDGPVVVNIKDPSNIDISGVISSRNSYTFTHSEREYFVDYKFDYKPTPQLILTPQIGFIYSRLNQMNYVFFDSPEGGGFRELTEIVNNRAAGMRTGLSLEVPLGHDFSFLCGSLYTLSHNKSHLDAKEFDSSGPTVMATDERARLSHTADLTMGIQKKFGHAVVAVSGGFSFYSYMPRVVNPIKATDANVHLGETTASSQYVQASVSYAI